jgi:small subunit ribosomal protein S8
MSMTDPIADFLTRIRNGIHSRHASVECPRSSLKVRIAEILRDEGYLDAVTLLSDSKQGSLKVTLRYHDRHSCVIVGLRRVSKPGQRRYVNSKNLPKVRNGLGIAIVSTSVGVMTDREARKRGVGGEVLCEVW